MRIRSVLLALVLALPAQAQRRDTSDVRIPTRKPATTRAVPKTDTVEVFTLVPVPTVHLVPGISPKARTDTVRRWSPVPIIGGLVAGGWLAWWLRREVAVTDTLYATVGTGRVDTVTVLTPTVPDTMVAPGRTDTVRVAGPGRTDTVVVSGPGRTDTVVVTRTDTTSVPGPGRTDTVTVWFPGPGRTDTLRVHYPNPGPKTTVPEPATVFLVAGGVGLLALVRRRR
jgi:hypothetical protein